jgi:large subunit ribosomal protein L29
MAQSKLNASAFTQEELVEELKNAEVKYRNLRFDHSTRGLENPLDLIEVRRDIARLKTEMRKRELATASEEQLANRSKKVARRKRQRQAAKVAKRRMAAKRK